MKRHPTAANITLVVLAFLASRQAWAQQAMDREGTPEEDGHQYPPQYPQDDQQYQPDNPMPMPMPMGVERVYPIVAGSDGSYDSAAFDATVVPPNAEGIPYPAEKGGYCYVGGHPVDTRVVPGPAWDPTEGEHVRSYPPVDMRLFSLHDGCYYFIGDPRDFGYGGATYAYYGAHPVLDSFGGGWCFMMGGHTHLWRPWSPDFTVVGSWNYWRGPYDPFFWTYWPYYSVYYRSYYPHYYGGGRFYRGGSHQVAPPIRGIPASTWRSQVPGRGAPVVRGTPPPQMYRPSGAAGPAPGVPNRAYGAPPSPGRPAFSPAPRPFAPAPQNLFHGSGNFNTQGGFHGGRR